MSFISATINYSKELALIAQYLIFIMSYNFHNCLSLHLFVKILYFPQNKSLFCLISIFSAKFSHLFTKLLHYFSHFFRKCFHFSRPFRILFAREKLKSFRERTNAKIKRNFRETIFTFRWKP